jgi:hypothetical protein
MLRVAAVLDDELAAKGDAIKAGVTCASLEPRRVKVSGKRLPGRVRDVLVKACS